MKTSTSFLAVLSLCIFLTGRAYGLCSSYTYMPLKPFEGGGVVVFNNGAVEKLVFGGKPSYSNGGSCSTNINVYFSSVTVNSVNYTCVKANFMDFFCRVQ